MPQKTHGLSRSSPEYKAWSAIKQRCFNPKDKAYKHYGKRGIVLCEEWRTDFLAFYSSVGQRPSNEHSLERIDNNLGYTPGNVKWATKDVQQHNRRAYGRSGLKGVYKNGSRWMARLQRKGVDYYIGTFATPDEAHRAYLLRVEEIYG